MQPIALGTRTLQPGSIVAAGGTAISCSDVHGAETRPVASAASEESFPGACGVGHVCNVPRQPGTLQTCPTPLAPKGLPRQRRHGGKNNWPFPDDCGSLTYSA